MGMRRSPSPMSECTLAAQKTGNLLLQSSFQDFAGPQPGKMNRFSKESVDNIDPMADQEPPTWPYRLAVWLILAACLGLAVRYVWVAWERHGSTTVESVTTEGGWA